MMRKTGCRMAFLGMAAAVGLLAGCGAPTKALEQRMKDKEECTLEIEDVMRVTYDGTGYVLLKETAQKEEVGTWVGYIQKLVGVEKTGKVLFCEELLQGLDKMAEIDQSADLVVTFLNVYQTREEDKEVLLVDVNGNYQKAVTEEMLEDKGEPLFVADLLDSYETAGDFAINQENATQLVCGEAVYQVTDEEVPLDQLGVYLDCIAQRVTFDSDTKEIIASGELGRIDWMGEEEAKRGRTVWLYTDVYEIQGTEKTSMVAVRVNGDYRVAKIRR